MGVAERIWDGSCPGYLFGPHPPSESLLDAIDAVEPGRLWLSWDAERARWALYRRCPDEDRILWWIEDERGGFLPPDLRIVAKLHASDCAKFSLRDRNTERRIAREREKRRYEEDVEGCAGEFLDALAKRRTTNVYGADGHKWGTGEMFPRKPPGKPHRNKLGVRYPTIWKTPKG